MAWASSSVPWLMAKNMAEAWIAWSLNAARNWATSRPRKVRERRLSAGSNGEDMAILSGVREEVS